jgi:hypothetical protein
MIDITATKVVEAFFMYGILHGGVWLFFRLFKPVEKLVKSEAHQIVLQHSKSGHKSRLKDCQQDDCANLQTLKQQELQAVVSVEQ